MSFSKSHQIFYINSANRNDPEKESDADFSYTIPIDSTINYDSLCVLAASIPKSYYLIQDGFNTFTLQEGINLATITIPPGNYSYLSFMAVLPGLLNSKSPNGWTYSMSYPNRLTQADTGLFTYSVTGNSGQPSFITTTNVFEQLGFNQNTTNTFIMNTLVSTSVINFSQEQSLFLHCDCCLNGVGNDDILQEIYDWNSPPMSFIVYQNEGNIEGYSKLFRVTSTNVLKFSLTNEFGRVMNLNGRNQLITLLIYKRDNLSEVIREVIRLHMK